MGFEYKKFLTENKLTNQSKVKALFERDQSDEHESFSTELESELDKMLEDQKIDSVLRNAAQDELEKNIGEYYSTYQVHNFSSAIDELIKDAKKNLELKAKSGKLSEIEEEEPDMDAGPSAKEITKGSTVELAKKQNQLAKLLKRKDELVSKFKNNEINIDQYKQMIGHIPQHIKTLTADIEKLEGGELNEASNEALERMEGLINRRDLELFKNALENITNELEQEGFELSDIKAYIQRELDEILGIYK